MDVFAIYITGLWGFCTVEDVVLPCSISFGAVSGQLHLFWLGCWRGGHCRQHCTEEYDWVGAVGENMH